MKYEIQRLRCNNDISEKKKSERIDKISKIIKPDIIGYEKPIGLYKWYAKEKEVNKLLKDFDKEKRDILMKKLDKVGNYYYIYVGIAVKESLLERIDWHINDNHSQSKIKYGTLSTLRQSISSLLFQDQSKEKETNNFMNNLYVEIEKIDEKDKYNEKELKIIKDEIEKEEKEEMKKYVLLLNIRDNKNEYIKEFKSYLKKERKKAKEKGMKKYE